MSHKSPIPERFQVSQLPLENLCAWIDEHIEQPIGWPELMLQSGLSYQALQSLFWRWKATTPMTWIRQRRNIAKALPAQSGAIRLKSILLRSKDTQFGRYEEICTSHCAQPVRADHYGDHA